MSKPTENILTVSNLNKRFYSRRGIVNAIDNVSFEVKEGEVVGLIGESGSGKTTIGRTIINLHQADSGSIKFKGIEIGGKKINRKQKRDLYWNIQMIFQDPYSSLNGQKNIRGILAESITAKKLDVKLLEDALTNRDEVLKYFGGSLKKSFWLHYWNYLKFSYQTQIKYLNQILNELNEFKINNNESRNVNINRLNSHFLDHKELMSNDILNNLEDFISSVSSTWSNAQNSYLESKFDFKDEQDLRQNIKDIEYNLLRQRYSEASLELLNELKFQKQTLADVKNNFDSLIAKSRNSIKQTIKEFKKEIYAIIVKKHMSTTTKEFNYIAFEEKREKFLLKIVKGLAKEKVIALDVAQEIDYLRQSLSVKFRGRIEDSYKNTTDFSLIETDIWNEDLYLEVFQKLNDKLHGLYLKEHQIVEEWTNIVFNSETKFNSCEKPSENEVALLKQENEVLQQKNIEFKKVFDQEIEAYQANLNSWIEEQKKFHEAENITLLNQVKELDKNANDLYNSLFNQIISEIPFSNDEFKSDKTSQKTFKRAKIKNFESVTELENEIKRNFKEVKILQVLLKVKDVKLNVLHKYLIKRALIKHKVFETLELVGLNKSHAYSYPHEFSGGMRQRVGIARAIISDPKLIIADEPIAALDLSIQAQIVNLLLKLKRQKGLSMIFIAHDLSMVEFNSDKVLIMHLGKIVEYGKTSKIFENPIHPYTKNLISSMPTFEKIHDGFEDNKFEPEYLKTYSDFVQPIYHEIDSDHFVLATQEQFEQWRK